MNGWVSMLFTVMGGIMFLMKNKTNENGGGGYTVVNDNTPAPSPSEEDMSHITEEDVIADPSLLSVMKISDPDRYEELTQSIWRNMSAKQKYVQQTYYLYGSKLVDMPDKEEEIIKLLEEGFTTEYVGRSVSGENFVEVFTKKDDNIGWNSRGDKVGITIFEILINNPDQGQVRIRDYELADETRHEYNHYISEFNKYYAEL